ncbi:hypothetical protein BDF21DRAFT_459397 [Thamnidium elegans]|nr:hypothetical protein BDF21DRAFT_459397 [Thamnidium elegans]
MCTEIDTRKSSISNDDYSLVANSNLVPNSTSIISSNTYSDTNDINSIIITNNNVANNKQRLETRRMEIIYNKYNNPQLTDDARNILISKHLKNNTTNQSYKPGQLLFLQWALDNNISQTEFSAIDLINFLSNMFSLKGYAVTTIQLFRSAVTHLHNNPQSLRENQDLNEFVTTILNQAPLIRLHKSTINLQPTFTFLKNTENGTTSLAELQSKLAFLLAVTCFLRPSDLHRIPINSMKIENNNTELSFDVNCPKEKRDRRMIVKIFQVKAHQEPHLCPVTRSNLSFNEENSIQALEKFEALSDEHEVCYLTDPAIPVLASKLQISKYPFSFHTYKSCENTVSNTYKDVTSALTQRA